MFAAIKKRIKFKSDSTQGSSKGVISLEACIVLPIFILTIMFFYGLIIMFLGQNTMAHAMIQSAQSLSLDAFASDKIAGDFGAIDEENSEQLLSALYGEIFTEQDGYFSTSENWKDGESSDVEEVVKKRFLAYLAGSGGNIENKADSMLEFLRVEDGVNGLDFSGSSVDDGVLTIKMKYRQKFIFDFNGLAAFDREETLSINLWSN